MWIILLCLPHTLLILKLSHSLTLLGFYYFPIFLNYFILYSHSIEYCIHYKKVIKKTCHNIGTKNVTTHQIQTIISIQKWTKKKEPKARKKFFIENKFMSFLPLVLTEYLYNNRFYITVYILQRDEFKKWNEMVLIFLSVLDACWKYIWKKEGDLKLVFQFFLFSGICKDA